ncbi:hypothetical protein ACIPVK_12035 [Paeniglutamicibacter sp. MACA_103]|uniref:hypothetical protein n=1 Tax=Paeniglutamicibacter sp. MACA_103 TaxID=3377337 RepID=UPI0038947F91
MAGMRRRRPTGLAALLLAALAVPGCSVSGPCPAIGWINTVGIRLTGAVHDVAAVGVCADGECVTSAPPDSDDPLRPLAPGAPAAATPTLHAIASPFFVSRVDQRTWQASVAMSTPETLTLRVLGTTGHVLVERDVALQWRRVGGSERCGGPVEAGPVIVDIPS